MKVSFDADYIREASELGINIDAITREGHRVRIVDWNDNETYSLSGYDLDSKDPSTHRTWKKDGTYFREGMEHSRDLLYMNI